MHSSLIIEHSPHTRRHVHIIQYYSDRVPDSCRTSRTYSRQNRNNPSVNSSSTWMQGRASIHTRPNDGPSLPPQKKNRPELSIHKRTSSSVSSQKLETEQEKHKSHLGDWNPKARTKLLQPSVHEYHFSSFLVRLPRPSA